MTYGGSTATQTSGQAAAGTAESAQARVLVAIDRLLTAGALYPTGHDRFTAAVDAYRAAASAACGARRLEMEATGDTLRIQDVPLAAGLRGEERLLGLCDRLGIRSVRIDADAPADALHQLATGLLRERRQADETGHLKQTAFAGLPEQVEVVPRVFRKRWSDGIDHRLIPIIEVIMDDAVATCTSPEDARATRDTLERMFAAILADQDRDGEATLCLLADQVRVTALLNEQPRQFADAIRGIIRRDGSLARIDELLDTSHEALSAAATQRAVQMLVEAMQGADVAGADTPPGIDDRRVDDENVYTIPLEDLHRQFAEIEAACPPDVLPAPGDLREEIAVYLSLLGLGATEDVARQALSGLWHTVQQAGTAADRDFLREVAGQLLQSADHEMLDQILPRLAGPFRDRGSDEAAAFWSALAARDEDQLAAIWPHVVLDLLRTEPEAGRQGLSVMQALATDLTPERMRQEVARLEQLPSFRLASCAKSLFYRPLPLLHPVFAALLATSLGDEFGVWLQEGLERQPADTAGGLLARVLGPYRSQHRDFYETVLRHDPDVGGGAPPRTLLSLVRQAVERLDPTERSQEWVPVAILVLATWGTDASRELLERVTGERRLMVLPVWPRLCRQAARQGLADTTREDGKRRRGGDRGP